MSNSQKPGRHRVVMVQYAGDYREAATRLAVGGEETYYGQRYSVTSVGAIGQRVEQMSVIACLTDSSYDEVLSNGVRAIGAGLQPPVSAAQVIRLVAALKPTELVVCTPMRALLAWGIRNRVRTLALLADSFQDGTLRARVRNALLVRLLNRPQIEWVANHNINASRSVESIGVPGEKIIPWDWTAQVTPALFTPKAAPDNAACPRLLYVGQVTEAKGVGDVLRAIAELKQRGRRVTLQVAGKGDGEVYRNLADQLSITDQIEFLGLVANHTVVRLMRAADIVVIPSRHEYPEGLPLTIYEALCSRTPIVASDHPMFRDKLVDGKSALTFRAGSVSELADAVEAMASSPDLYRSLSEHSAEAWSALQVPVKFAELLRHWISNQPEDREWLSSYRLASGRYGELN